MSEFLSLSHLLALLACVGMLLLCAAAVAVLRHLVDTRPDASILSFPPVSLLKPLKGMEDNLEANLRSFFELRYASDFEMVFAATDTQDPALALAKRIAEDYPHVPTQFVISDPNFGMNPKVSNLAGALDAARYDLFLQTDANVQVKRDYLSSLVREMLTTESHLITSPVIGVGEETLGAALENLQLSTYIAPAMCLALKAANVHCVCGKSMLLRQSDLEKVGGLRGVRNILCEDFVLGERFKAEGFTVTLSRHPVENVNQHCGVERFTSRHSRWLKMRATLHLGGFIADLIGNPVALATLAVVVGGFDADLVLFLAAIVISKMVVESFVIAKIRTPMEVHHALLSPIKDLMFFVMWVIACFSRTVVWRGKRLRFSRHTALIPLEPAPSELSKDGVRARTVAERSKRAA